MRIFALLTAAAVIAACQPQDAPETDADAAPAEAASAAMETDALLQGEAYGEPITLTEITPISAILDDPQAFVGKKVLVKGMIVEVCEMRGCWMDLASDRAYEKLQIKVEDGVIVFPLSARGKTAVAEGTVEELQLTYEEALEAARHRAEEHGLEFDPSTVTGPETTYRIWATGAVISE
jgi:hypothetical protein